METNKQEFHMMKGCQGSGKSTLAKELLAKLPNSIRINNDELRLTLFNRPFDVKDSKTIDSVREKMIVDFLERGLTVIVDNMNLSPKYEIAYRALAEKYNIRFVIHDLTSVLLKDCIERDRKRERPVGEKVIRETYRKYIQKDPPKIPWILNAPEAIICDLDGTLAIMKDRSPYDEAKADQDEVNHQVNMILSYLRDAYDSVGKRTVILLSGRDEGRGREATERWLDKNNIYWDHLYMRKAGDVRSDDIVKEEFYNNHIKGKYNILAVLDDRLRVCRLWYRLGLPLLRVGDPDADF